MTTIEDLNREINNLEAKLEATRKARKEEEKRLKEKQEKDNAQAKAARYINQGVEYIKQGFSYIMKEEEIQTLSKTLLNENIIPLCWSLVKLEKNPLFKNLFSFEENTNNNSIRSINTEPDINSIIEDFLTAIGE